MEDHMRYTFSFFSILSNIYDYTFLCLIYFTTYDELHYTNYGGLDTNLWGKNRGTVDKVWNRIKGVVFDSWMVQPGSWNLNQELSQGSHISSVGWQNHPYKFPELLAAGTIHVVLTDDWMYPFRCALVDWNECVVIFTRDIFWSSRNSCIEV
jgi:hypothetical protein